MRGFEQFLSTTADVADRQIAYYVQWARQAYEMAAESLSEPLSHRYRAHATRQWRGRS